MKSANQPPDARSDAAREWRRWYWTPRWRAKARAQLRAEPLCAIHLKAGQVVPASVCDHVLPHKGDEALFWDDGNLQSLCSRCHNSDKQTMERGGSLRHAIGTDGWPIG